MIPILDHKHPDQPSVFDPANLLREARRQKAVPLGNVPEICILDPDGDLSRQLQDQGARRNPHWACYHTEMFALEMGSEIVGVVGCAAVASFGGLVAEQLFSTGCALRSSVA